jgi:F-box/TPR repeat protein Pof3
LRQVPKSDRLYDTIEAQLRKIKGLLEKQLSLSKSNDPVSILPAELVELIMAHLEYVDVVKCLQVSKSWNLALSRSRPLIDTVDFSDAKRTINYKMMVAALKRLGPVPKTLIMKDLAGPATDLLRINLERWRNYTQLEQLDISSFMFGSWASGLRLLPFSKYSLKSLTIKEGRLRGRTVVEMMRACSSLETARFSNIYGALWKSQSSTAADLFPTVRILELGGDKLFTFSVNIYVSL